LSLSQSAIRHLKPKKKKEKKKKVCFKSFAHSLKFCSGWIESRGLGLCKSFSEGFVRVVWRPSSADCFNPCRISIPRDRDRDRDPGISEMATIRSPVVAPAFVEGMASKGQQLQSMKFRSSDVFGGRALQDRSRMLLKGKLVVMVEEEDVEKKRCKQQARASMGPADKLPANHKVKAASLKAFEELRNASANRYTSAKSSIMVLGLSVHSTPVEMREKLAVPEAEWPRAIAELSGQNHIEEAAVLSTCNRMEIYVVALSWNRGVREVTEWMSKVRVFLSPWDSSVFFPDAFRFGWVSSTICPAAI
jgi:hypothetical protein